MSGEFGETSAEDVPLPEADDERLAEADSEMLAQVDNDLLAEDDGAGVLSQNLIDDLLGIFPMAPADEPTGIAALYEHGVIPQVRSLALEGVFERSSRSLEVNLRKVALDAVEVGLQRIVTTRCQTFLEGVAVPALLAIVKTSWGGCIIVELSADLIYMLVEMTFGGTASTFGATVEGRGFTPIELRVARRLIDEIIPSLADNMSAIAPATLEFELFESIPRFVDVAPPHSLAVVANLIVKVGDTSTGLNILVPQATLSPVQHLLNGQRITESGQDDNLWEEHLQAETLRSTVAVDVRLCQKTVRLGDVLTLAVGDTVTFDASPDQSVNLVCDGRVVAVGKIGRSQDRMAVRVVRRVSPES